MNGSPGPFLANFRGGLDDLLYSFCDHGNHDHLLSAATPGLFTSGRSVSSGSSRSLEDGLAYYIRVAPIARLQALVLVEVKQQFDNVGAALRSVVAFTVQA